MKALGFSGKQLAVIAALVVAVPMAVVEIKKFFPKNDKKA